MRLTQHVHTILHLLTQNDHVGNATCREPAAGKSTAVEKLQDSAPNHRTYRRRWSSGESRGPYACFRNPLA
ncbi:hypothetical protein JOD47_000619 [Arthrobacter tumbae]|nr:hypothetical protein [Arthrobacter tumbae]